MRLKLAPKTVWRWITMSDIEHSKDFDKIKRWYDNGLWKVKHVRAAVGKKITVDEFKEITGEDY